MRTDETGDRDITILDSLHADVAGRDAWRGIAWQYTDELHAVEELDRPRRDLLTPFLATLPVRYRRYTFDNLRAHAGNQAAIAATQALDTTSNLYLWGHAGNGKTHLALALAHDRATAVDAAFWNAATLFSTLRRAAIGAADWPELQRPRLLILDDIGKAKPTEFVYQELYRVLEERWSDERQTIFTANHRPSEAAARLTEDGESARAILSRLAAGSVVEVKGQDSRIGGTS